MRRSRSAPPRARSDFGSRSMPFCAKKPWISSTAPSAMKTSSPKNKPTLSVAAAIARTRSCPSSSSRGSIFSAAASAIGASSGRTVCGWPATVFRPNIDSTWRIARYAISNRANVSRQSWPIQISRALAQARRVRAIRSPAASAPAASACGCPMNVWPNSASRSGTDMPDSSALTTPAATTTSAGFRRSANPDDDDGDAQQWPVIHAVRLPITD